MNNLVNKNIKNNIKMKNQKQMRAALPVANKLQSMYNAMGIASTQNVRNPLPMKELVKLVLPVIHTRGIFFDGSPVRVMAFGKRVTVIPQSFVSPETIFGNDYISKQAKSTDTIVEELKQRGFVVNSRQAVLTALCTSANVKRINAPDKMVEVYRAKKENEGKTISAAWSGDTEKLNGETAKSLGCFHHNLYYIQAD